MLSFTGSLRVFIALEPVDMRAGINTLQALVSERLKGEVRGGALFVFTNKRRRLIKILYWDGTGMWLMLKRHAPQCAYWFVFENPLSLSSALREGL
jgi:transposase